MASETTVIHIRIDKKLLDQIKRLAKSEERTDAKMITFALREWMKTQVSR